jgi:hypothetical protein
LLLPGASELEHMAMLSHRFAVCLKTGARQL